MKTQVHQYYEGRKRIWKPLKSKYFQYKIGAFGLRHLSGYFNLCHKSFVFIYSYHFLSYTKITIGRSKYFNKFWSMASVKYSWRHLKPNIGLVIDVSAATECVRLILGTESRAKLKQLFHCIHYCLITVIKSYANF